MSHCGSFLRRISLDITPLPHSPSDTQDNEGQIITLSGRLKVYLPEGTVRICSRVRPREPSGTQIHDPVGRMLWSLKDQGLSKLPEEIQGNTQSPTVAPRGHVGFGLRFKVKAALRHTV